MPKKLAYSINNLSIIYGWLEMMTPERINDDALKIALSELFRYDPSFCRIVELHYFRGLSIEETAAAIGISKGQVKRKWFFARAWLRQEGLDVDVNNPPGGETTGVKPKPSDPSGLPPAMVELETC